MEPVNLSPVAQDTPTERADESAYIGSANFEFKPLYERYNAAENPRTDRIFEQIWSWAKAQAPEKDKDSIMWEITKLSNRLGSAGVGEKPWTKVIAYVSTHNQMVESERRLRQMERL